MRECVRVLIRACNEYVRWLVVCVCVCACECECVSEWGEGVVTVSGMQRLSTAPIQQGKLDVG